MTDTDQHARNVETAKAAVTAAHKAVHDAAEACFVAALHTPDGATADIDQERQLAAYEALCEIRDHVARQCTMIGAPRA